MLCCDVLHVVLRMCCKYVLHIVLCCVVMHVALCCVVMCCMVRYAVLCGCVVLCCVAVPFHSVLCYSDIKFHTGQA